MSSSYVPTKFFSNTYFKNTDETKIEPLLRYHLPIKSLSNIIRVQCQLQVSLNQGQWWNVLKFSDKRKCLICWSVLYKLSICIGYWFLKTDRWLPVDSRRCMKSKRSYVPMRYSKNRCVCCCNGSNKWKWCQKSPNVRHHCSVDWDTQMSLRHLQY